MPERKPFLLRLDPELYAALQMWARDELRSLNAQIEFLLRRDLQAAKRLKGGGPAERGSKRREEAAQLDEPGEMKGEEDS